MLLACIVPLYLEVLVVVLFMHSQEDEQMTKF